MAFPKRTLSDRITDAASAWFFRRSAPVQCVMEWIGMGLALTGSGFVAMIIFTAVFTPVPPAVADTRPQAEMSIATPARTGAATSSVVNPVVRYRLKETTVSVYPLVPGTTCLYEAVVGDSGPVVSVFAASCKY